MKAELQPGPIQGHGPGPCNLNPASSPLPSALKAAGAGSGSQPPRKSVSFCPSAKRSGDIGLFPCDDLSETGNMAHHTPTSTTCTPSTTPSTPHPAASSLLLQVMMEAVAWMGGVPQAALDLAVASQGLKGAAPILRADQLYEAADRIAQNPLLHQQLTDQLTQLQRAAEREACHLKDEEESQFCQEAHLLKEEGDIQIFKEQDHLQHVKEQDHLQRIKEGNNLQSIEEQKGVHQGDLLPCRQQLSSHLPDVQDDNPPRKGQLDTQNMPPKDEKKGDNTSPKIPSHHTPAIEDHFQKMCELIPTSDKTVSSPHSAYYPSSSISSLTAASPVICNNHDSLRSEMSGASCLRDKSSLSPAHLTTKSNKEKMSVSILRENASTSISPEKMPGPAVPAQTPHSLSQDLLHSKPEADVAPAEMREEIQPSEVPRDEESHDLSSRDLFQDSCPSTSEAVPSSPPALTRGEDASFARRQLLQKSESSASTQPCSSTSTGGLPAAKQRLQVLLAENRRLKQRQKCRACRQVDLAASGVTFLPCGHFLTCPQCSDTFTDCPACGRNIMGTVRTFLS